jgi:hypothetical protein
MQATLQASIGVQPHDSHSDRDAALARQHSIIERFGSALAACTYSWFGDSVLPVNANQSLSS